MSAGNYIRHTGPTNGKGLAYKMALRMTEEEYQEYVQRNAQRTRLDPFRALMEEKPQKRPKYGNKRVVVDGMKFDSQHEADVYQGLMALVRQGELKCVCRQVKFDLPGGIQYIADFVTILPDMRIEAVIDAKSEITKKNRVYINKKKQMKAVWGIEIKEV